MRRPFIAGNWKMHLTRAESVELASGISARAADFPKVDLAVCPPSIYLDAVSTAISKSALGLGAQNMHDQPAGAYTGEISAKMLVDIGCRFVILGHSERRHIFGETNEMINQKVKAAFENGLTPIVCVGETLDQRKAGETNDVVRSQLEGSLAGLSQEQMEQTVIAYEPVWAIGTGEVATPDQAEAVHAELRSLITKQYNAATADAVRIQYGGSVKPENAAKLLAQPNIDGALVGGAALKVDSFLEIAKQAAV